MRRFSLAPVLLAVTVSMTVAEFIEVQQLSPDALRTRFALPPACDPAVTALTTDSAASRVMVAIECRVKPGGNPPPGGPTPPGRPAERIR